MHPLQSDHIGLSTREELQVSQGKEAQDVKPYIQVMKWENEESN